MIFDLTSRKLYILNQKSTMYKIAWMPGDGIGSEVMRAARRVLDALQFDAEYISADIGWEFWRNEGEALPQRTLDILRAADCALFGAITSKPKEEADAELAPELRGKGLVYRSPIVRLRQMFDLYVNLRPCKTFPGNPLNFRDGIDLVVFRENTEGLYSGVEFFPLPANVRGALETSSKAMGAFKDVASDDIAFSARLITRQGTERIARKAFAYAQAHGYPTVTLMEKPNVLRETSGLFTRITRQVAKEFPGIKLLEVNIDAMVAELVKQPEQYGVLLASNLFGDIISDLTAQLVGGLGFAPSGNLGDQFAVFEPTHGSAPDIAGKGIANPLAMFLAVKMMLDWLGEADRAMRLEHAIAAVIADGRVRTRDMGGENTTAEMTGAVVGKI